MNRVSRYSRYGLFAAFVALFAAFSLASPTFLTFPNMKSVVINHFALLSLVSLGMTLVVAAGGIDLSIGVAVDMASLGYIQVLAHGGSPAEAILAALAGAAAVGAFNAALISGLGMPAFLARSARCSSARASSSLRPTEASPSISSPARRVRSSASSTV
jgi:ribose transport system permease protein